MRVVVGDASVLNALEREKLLQASLKMGIELTISDILLDQELQAYGGPELLRHGLLVESLTETELEAALGVRRQRTGLSAVDASLLCLAHGRGWALLTSCAIMRAHALGRSMDCHDLLWLFDRHEEAQVIKLPVLADCLERLAIHPGCRLPRQPVQTRIERYRSRRGE